MSCPDPEAPPGYCVAEDTLGSVTELIDDPDAMEYALAYGVTPQEALVRFAVMDAAGELGAVLETAEPDTYSGLWIEHEAEFLVAVAFTTPESSSTPALDPYIDGTPLEGRTALRQATFSLAELYDHAQVIIDTAPDVPYDMTIHVGGNEIEVIVASDGAEQAFNDPAYDLPPSAAIIRRDSLATLASRVYGGLPLDGGPEGDPCTVGYSVEEINGKRKGVVTAGHCKDEKEQYPQRVFKGYGQQQTVLPNERQWTKASHDVQWHTTPGLWDQPKVWDGQPTKETPYYRWVRGTKHRKNQDEGMRVCKYGRVTGYTCGNIVRKNVKANVLGSKATYVLVDKSGVDLSSKGDSGAPWFRGGTAYGIHVASGGGPPGQSGNDNQAIYMPINFVEGLGVRVRTKPYGDYSSSGWMSENPAPPPCEEAEWGEPCPPPAPPPPSWSEWELHPGDIDSGIDAASWEGSGIVAPFARSDDGRLIVRWWDGADWQPGGVGGGWYDMGTIVDTSGTEIPLVGDPSVVSWAPGRWDVFARGADDEIWWLPFDASGWGAWSPLGAPTVEDIPGVPLLETTGATSSPDAASLSAGHLAVFARGVDNALWQRTYTDPDPADGAPGSWGAWESLGGNLASDPSAASWSEDRMDVFASGADGQLYSRSWEDPGGWTPSWKPLGGQLASGPDAVSWGPSRIDIVARGTDDRLYHKALRNGNWSGWGDLGGALVGDPGIASWGAGRLDVFARTSSGPMVHKWCDLSPGCPDPGQGQMPLGGGNVSVPRFRSARADFKRTEPIQGPIQWCFPPPWGPEPCPQGESELRIPRPSGVQAGDVLIAVLAWEDVPPIEPPLAPQQGWRLVRGDHDGRCAQSMLWTVATASEPDDYVWIFGQKWTWAAGVVAAYEAADGTQPTWLSSGGSDPASRTSAAPPLLLERPTRLVFAGHGDQASLPMGMGARAGASGLLLADEPWFGTGLTGERSAGGGRCAIGQMLALTAPDS